MVGGDGGLDAVAGLAALSERWWRVEALAGARASSIARIPGCPPVLVGHNVALDMRFFAEQEARTGVRLRQPVLATLLFSPVVHPDHRDLRLLRLLEERGITTLGQALEASRRTMAARVSESLYARR